MKKSGASIASSTVIPNRITFSSPWKVRWCRPDPIEAKPSTGRPPRNRIPVCVGAGSRDPGSRRAICACWKDAGSPIVIPSTTIAVLPHRTALMLWVIAAMLPSASIATTSSEWPGPRRAQLPKGSPACMTFHSRSAWSGVTRAAGVNSPPTSDAAISGGRKSSSEARVTSSAVRRASGDSVQWPPSSSPEAAASRCPSIIVTPPLLGGGFVYSSQPSPRSATSGSSQMTS